MNYIDSMLPIYAITHKGKAGRWARGIIQKIQNGYLAACTSFLTFDEVYYKINKLLGTALALENIEAFLMTPNLRFIPVDDIVAWKALELVREYQLLPRDAIHAGTALLNGAQTVYSEDSDFDTIKGIKRLWFRK
jgi:predicted nucleic acid-binding protein